MRFRITPILIVLILSIGLPKWNYAQSSGIILNETFENLSLLNVLEILKNNYQVKVSYDPAVVKGILVNKTFQNHPLSAALKELFRSTPLVFQLLDEKELLIRRKSQKELSLETIEVKGWVKDGFNGSPLAFASIQFGPSVGTETDDQGYFSIKCTRDQVQENLTVYYLGYQAQSIPSYSVSETDPVTIRLLPKTESIRTVVITEKEPIISQPRKSNAPLTFDLTKLNTLPAFVGGYDPLRTLQLLPGVGADDDYSSELRVRGGNGEENIVLLDGIPLYDVGHYFGIFSLINPSVVDEVKLYKNNFPIEFGGRTASVVDISTHPLDSIKFNGNAEVNLLTTNAQLSIPLSSNFGILLGGRITNKNIANNGLFNLLDQNSTRPSDATLTANTNTENTIVGIDPNFRFYDFNAKAFWEITPTLTAKASFFSGQDQFDYNVAQEFSSRNRFEDTGLFQESSTWRNQGWSLQLDKQWSGSFLTNISFSHSMHENENSVTSSFNRYIIPRDEFRFLSISNKNTNSIKGTEFKIKNDWLINHNNQFSFGAQLVDNKTEALFQIEDRPILEVDVAGQQYITFGEYKTKIGNDLDLSMGLRSTYYTYLEKNYWSPRINLNYRLNQQWHLKSSWNLYNQFLRRSIHENRLGRLFNFWVLSDDRRFPVSEARQWMIGTNWKGNTFEFDVEFYHKKMEGVIEHALVVNGFDQVQEGPSTSQDYRIFTGSGQSIGVDILLKKTAGSYTGWLAYTLSKTTQQFPQINNGQSYVSPDDRRHQLKWINQYNWGNWNFSLVYIFTSGAPYTDLSILATGPRDRRFTDPNLRISFLKDYHRVDAGVNYQFSLFGLKAETGLSIFNLFNHRNVKYRQFIYSLKPTSNSTNPIRLIGTELEMLGLTPNFSFKFHFGS